MLISEKIKDYMDENTVCINEKEVLSLGLAIARPGIPIATYIQSESFFQKIGNDIKVVITTSELAKSYSNERVGLIICENPQLIFFKLHNALFADSDYARRTTASVIDATASISESAIVDNNNVIIKENVIIEDNVVIRRNTTIESNSIIRAGSIIGGEGFEFKRDGDSVFGVKHLGGVYIGSNVEIQHNTCVDKAIYPWDDTYLDDYVKVDNFVHIGHACKVGKGTMIAAGSILGGRTEIGNYSWIGINATTRNGIKIGSNSRVNMGAVATKDVDDGEAVTGNFAISHDRFINRIKQE